MTVDQTCPNCLGRGMKIFHQATAVPTNSCILLDSRELALSYPRGDIQLGFCPQCSFISNLAFDPALTEYSGRYEETQGFSGTFNAFHRQLAEKLIEKYNLRNKTILEIGCGKGEFLMLMAELGNNRGFGFDPGYHEARNTSPAADKVEFIVDFYSEKYADYQADFVCCKMTLEHIPATAEFLQMVRKTIGNRLDTLVFFQIPETTRILEDCAFEDIYYEHCSYFTPLSLAYLFQSCGFEVLSIENQYAGQYLTIEARPAAQPETGRDHACVSDLAVLEAYVTSFPERFEHKAQYWRKTLDGMKQQGKRMVIWGSGSKGVAFLTTLGVGDDIEYAVDINPYRQGSFMPGCGQEIVAPDFLKSYRPDLVIVMNSIYCDEIREQLRSMDLSPELLAV